MAPTQVLKSYSFNLFTSSGSAAAIDAASEPHDGRCPDAMFLCAGAATPAYAVEMTEDDLVQGMNDGYWVQAWSAFVRRILSPLNELD